MRIRVALHTGEVELRDGDYFGRAVNRAARLRSLAAGGQILCSGATAELVVDTLPDDVVLADLGMRQLKNLARPEHVFELRLENADDSGLPQPMCPWSGPDLPAVLAGPGPFVGRGPELEQLLSAWQTTLDAGTRAVLIAGEPGVGKTRLAGEWSRHAYEQGAVVLYGRCDEDLGAPYQPFAEALRSLVPCLGAKRLRGLRGLEAILPLVPGLADALPDLAPPTRADPDTERYALFDAVVAMLGVASASAPVVLILDDLHWAAKPTLLLLRHLLRFGDQARVQIVGTYRSTDLDRSHPLAAMLADLHRDGSASRLALGGLDEGDVTAYVAEAGYDDEELARALASVTGGNPFFLIEALRHVDESGGHWDPSTLPQGVREAVSRRLSRLPAETNKALAAAAVVGSHFALALVESVVGDDLIDAFDEASKAGIVIEEAGGRYRFNHAIVRQSLLAELASVRRMRLHQKIAATLETEPGADDELLAELAYHYFECAWAGNATKAVEYCRRAADQAMARLAYEGAADLYDKAVHALEEIDSELPDRDDQQAELLVARCEALLAAGDVVSATGAVAQLQDAAGNSARLAAWGTCFDGQLSMLTDPERLDEVESALGAAAEKLASLDDAAGEAKAHTVRAGCLARLGRIGDCEAALDQALTAARRAGEHRRVNAVLAGAPLAALWGPNPVPRAGGRCLDVVRLLRITTGSPVVEATSTRCQAVLDALRGRAAAGRSLLDSARRALTELGMRHALLEVDQFAGILELVADDPAAAEPHLRRAYDGFRRMGLDADTAETAALLARVCLALDRDVEADELCMKSERLAGHALKASIVWRTVRAQLLARSGAHEEARRVADEAVAMTERTDALVDHGDACLALATVLGIAGDTAGARAAAEKAVGLYELKGAAALAEKACKMLGADVPPRIPAAPEELAVEPDNACVRVIRHLDAAFDREAWDEIEQLLAPVIVTENRRKIVGHPPVDLPKSEWAREGRRYRELGQVRHRHVFVAARGERLCLTRWEIGIADASPGAARDEMLQLFGLDEEGRIALQTWFDVEDVDAAVAALDAADARPSHRLENGASRAIERFLVLFAAADWDAIAATFTADYSYYDRRRVVNAGTRQGSTDAVDDLQAAVAVGITDATSTVIATRGAHVALARSQWSVADQRPEPFRMDVLQVAEVDADERMVASVAFDPDDIDAAFAELEARYLAGEAAPYRETWSVIASSFAAFNRHEVPMADWPTIDRRRATPFEPSDMTPSIRTIWELTPDLSIHIEAVHQLSNSGAVITHNGHGSSQEGFDAEWRAIDLLMVEDNRIVRCEIFDEVDLDSALARFDELSRPATRLRNAASQVHERLWTKFAARDWDGLAEMLADDALSDDRRRLVSAGIRRGRDSAIASLQAGADLADPAVTTTVIATRGERLALSRDFFSIEGQRFDAELLGVVEIDAHDRISARVIFGLDDIDAAFEELDTRYLAGEAKPHEHIWSVIAQGYAAANRGEFAATAPNVVNIDHRRLAMIESGELIPYLRDTFDELAHISTYLEAVHRLTDYGAVVTHVGAATSKEGFDAEWRMVNVIVVDGDLISRSEVFDETDLDAALARFEQLDRTAQQLNNAANQVLVHYLSHFPTRDWDVMGEALAEDLIADDRRHVVNRGVQHGRDSEIANIKGIAEIGCTEITTTPIAIRGEHLVLSSHSFVAPDWPGLDTEVIDVVEINTENQIVAAIAFDPDDIDAAFEELDARYTAGEAAAHANTWSVVAQSYVGFNRRELLTTTPDWVSIDHRRGAAFAAGDMVAYIQAAWDDSPDTKIYVAAVHRLSDLGAVVTHVAHGTSREGFDAEWRDIHVLTVDGDTLSRSELFDEVDLDAALARFEELGSVTPRLENGATRVDERFQAYFAARDWAAMGELLADDMSADDRRRVVNAGIRHGRDAKIADMRATADLGTKHATSTVIAIRGQRLALVRIRLSGSDQRPDAFHTAMLGIVEINADDRMAARILFDVDDLDAAFEELDARYLAGEAADYAPTWTVITQAFAALNRREVPATTLGWTRIDHRPLAPFQADDWAAFLQATWRLTPDVTTYIEAVHRLSNLGAVVTHTACGTSHEGFEAEWRMIDIFTVEGDLISGGELFDEADLDAALERFDELSTTAPRLENAASRTYDRFNAYLATRDWDVMTDMIADDVCDDDRRRVVSSGIRRGREAQIANLRAIVDVGVKNIESSVIAIRGDRLALTRSRVSGGDRWPEAFGLELLSIVETAADNRLVAGVQFDLDDIDAAFAELDARYLAGEAATCAHTWSMVNACYASLNRRELPPTTPDLVDVDHRRVTAMAPGELIDFVRASWNQMPDISYRVQSVHRLNNRGAVVTHAIHGTSREGFEAEWREIHLMTVEGDRFNRSEFFDEADLDAALARFDELSRPEPPAS